MGSSVPLQTATFCKWLGTLITMKWFLSKMGSSVGLQSATCTKWLWALITMKWFLSSMTSSMLLHITSWMKWLRPRAPIRSKNWTFGPNLDFFGKWSKFWTFLENGPKMQWIWTFSGKYSKNSPNFGPRCKINKIM